MEFGFEDSNFDAFVIYDYQATTSYWGPNKVGYDYDHQEHLPPRKRLHKRPTFEEFWNSDEIHNFRVNCSQHADWRKFKQWVVEQSKALEAGTRPVLDVDIQEKCGKFETYDDYDRTYEVPRDMAIFKYTKEFYTFPGEKYEAKSKYHEKVPQPKQLGPEHIKVWHYAESLSGEGSTAKPETTKNVKK